MPGLPTGSGFKNAHIFPFNFKFYGDPGSKWTKTAITLLTIFDAPFGYVLGPMEFVLFSTRQPFFIGWDPEC